MVKGLLKNVLYLTLDLDDNQIEFPKVLDNL